MAASASDASADAKRSLSPTSAPASRESGGGNPIASTAAPEADILRANSVDSAEPNDSTSLLATGERPKGDGLAGKRSHRGNTYDPIGGGDNLQGDGNRTLSEDSGWSTGELVGASKALERINRRRSTDCCCCLLFGAFWAQLLSISWSSVRGGDPRRLFHGFDYAGRLCGVDAEVIGKPLLYWPRPEAPAYPVCIAECPTAERAGSVLSPVERVSILERTGNLTEVMQLTFSHQRVETYPTQRVAGLFCMPDADGMPLAGSSPASTTALLATTTAATAVAAASATTATTTLVTTVTSADVTTTTTAGTVLGNAPAPVTALAPSLSSAVAAAGRSAPVAASSGAEPLPGPMASLAKQLHSKALGWPFIDSGATTSIEPGSVASWPFMDSGANTSKELGSVASWPFIANGSADASLLTNAARTSSGIVGAGNGNSTDAGDAEIASSASSSQEEDDEHDLVAEETMNWMYAGGPAPRMPGDNDTMQPTDNDFDPTEEAMKRLYGGGEEKRIETEHRDSDSIDGGAGDSVDPDEEAMEWLYGGRHPPSVTVTANSSDDMPFDMDVGTGDAFGDRHSVPPRNDSRVLQEKSPLESPGPAPAANGFDVEKQLQQQVARQAWVDQVRDAFKDVATGWLVLCFVLPFSVSASYAYFYLLKTAARLITWAVLGGMILCSSVIALYCFFLAGKSESRVMFGDSMVNHHFAVQALGIAAAVLTCILLVFLCYLRATVHSALGSLEASLDALWSLPRMLLLPVCEIGLKVAFVIVWLLLFAWVLSNGKMTAPTAVIDGTEVHGMVFRLTYSSSDKLNIVLYIIGLFWGLEMVTTIFQFVMGYAVVVWYFTPCRPDLSKPQVPRTVWETGLRCAVRYHMGSLALASAVVGGFRLPNLVLQFISKQAKGENPVSQVLANTCVCGIWFYEEIVRYMNKNATIELALNSSDFFRSARAAIQRIESAPPEVQSLNGITVVFQSIGTTCVTGFGSWIAYLLVTRLHFYSSRDSEWCLDNPMAVVAVAALISFVVSIAFMFMLDMTSDTLLFCWLCDTEDEGVEFATRPLRDLIGKPKWAAENGGAVIE